MRIKKLLLEEEKETFLSDCAYFIERNRLNFKDKNFLVRGTVTIYDQKIVKKDFRKRRRVKGDPMFTFLYEKFRPQNIPSRRDTVPCQNGVVSSLNDKWNSSSRDVYYVFPIGNNYKLVYTDGVFDFNIGNRFLRSSEMFSLIEFMRKIKRKIDYDHKYTREIYDIFGGVTKREYDEIMKYYKKGLNFIKNKKKFIKDIGLDYEKQVSMIEKNEKMIKEFFENTKVSKEIPQEKELEVNLYSSNGFYYVDPIKFKRILNNDIEMKQK